MVTATLPEKPKDHEFEEYTAAFLQASGYFLERTIVDRQEAEILELDIICSDYSSGASPKNRLIEIKSGGWGFSDVFKLRGWAEYLHMEDTDLVVCTRKSNHEFYERKCEEIRVGLYYHPNDPADSYQSKLYWTALADPVDVSALRFSYWLERTLLQNLKNKKKSLQDRKGYAAAEEYFHTLNSGIFFESNVVKRAHTLYKSYKTYPHISAKLGNELEGGDFDDDHERIPESLFRRTFFHAQRTDINISTYIEYRARLALLKAAVDFTLYERDGFEDRVRHEIEVLGLQISLKDMLPDSFLSGLEQIKTHKEFHLYPVFWQQFMWLFGGFILEDCREHEYKLLAMKTGLSEGEIGNALTAMDLLFQRSDSWFAYGTENSNITCLKAFPVPFMGVGANLRRLLYSDDQSFQMLPVTGRHTIDDLVKWNNLLVEWLAGQ